MSKSTIPQNPNSAVFGFVAPPNGGFFATQSYAITMLFSFVAGIFLTVAFSQSRLGAAAIVSTQTKLKGITDTFRVMERTKLALVVRRDLKMGQGKVAAQCAHAAVGVIDRIYEEQERAALKKSAFKREKSVPAEAATKSISASAAEQVMEAHEEGEAATNHAEYFDCSELDYHEEWLTWLSAWKATGSAKVVLQVETEQDLMDIVEAAKKANLPYTYIRDAGRTQIAAGSKTVCAVGPAPVSKVDQITGKLKLL